MLRVKPKVFQPAPGCLVGWKVVTNTRYPIYYKYSVDRCHKNGSNVRVPKYEVGTIHTAERCGSSYYYSRPAYAQLGKFKSAKDLKQKRTRYAKENKWQLDPTRLPGFYFFTTPERASRWSGGKPWRKSWQVIPIAYSPKSVVHTDKNDGLVVAYRIYILG